MLFNNTLLFYFWLDFKCSSAKVVRSFIIAKHVQSWPLRNSLKVTINERRLWYRSSPYGVSFIQIFYHVLCLMYSHIPLNIRTLVILAAIAAYYKLFKSNNSLLTLNRFHTFFWFSHSQIWASKYSAEKWTCWCLYC